MSTARSEEMLGRASRLWRLSLAVRLVIVLVLLPDLIYRQNLKLGSVYTQSLVTISHQRLEIGHLLTLSAPLPQLFVGTAVVSCRSADIREPWTIRGRLWIKGSVFGFTLTLVLLDTVELGTPFGI